MNVNLKQQNVGKTTYLVWDIDDASFRIDTFAMNMMSYNHMMHIIPTQIVKIDDRRQAQFNITGLTKMSNMMAEVRPKKEVLLLFNSILNAFEEVEAYMLDADHLLLDWEYVYLDEQRNCRMLYIPFIQFADTRDRIDFLREAVSRIKLDYQEQDTYLYDLLNAFSRGAIHTDSDFRELIKKSAGGSVQRQREEPGAERLEISYTPNRVVLPTAQEHQSKTEKNVPDKKTSANSRIPIINIPGREPETKAVSQGVVKEKKNRFSFGIPKKQKEKTMNPETVAKSGITETWETRDTAGFGQPVQNPAGLQSEMYESDEGTVIMQAPTEVQRRNTGMDFMPPAAVCLIRKRNGFSYPVSGNRVTVGSGATADICIDNNSTISREHALILYVDGQYYVEDYQSKNGSFINGARLRARMREPVYNGMTIKLSNEEFEFVIN